METELQDRVVLITGASGAIGSATARAFAAEGAAVGVGWHQSEAGAKDVAESIAAAGGRAETVWLDLGDPDSAAGAVRQVRETLGQITVLVGNAVHWPAEQDELEALTAGLQRNVVGTLAVVEACLPGMRAAGWGRIVLISSDIAAQPMAGPTAYPAAKGALEAACRALAVREAANGVLTNVVRPGFTLTDRALQTPWLGPSAVAAESERTPTGRICTPEDVAGAVVFLGSAANGHANGQVLSVAGGRELVR